MKISDIIAVVEGKVVCGDADPETDIEKAFASDLMSDVLTLTEDNLLLVTGLSNIQSVRTAEMSDIHFILLCRGKRAADDMVRLARENGLTLIETHLSVFHCCGLLFQNGLSPVY